jgi:hypothetical protein
MTAQQVTNGKVTIRDIVYILLILVTGLSTYYITKGNTDAQILELTKKSEMNAYRIDRNQIEVKEHCIKFDEQLDKINVKLDRLLDND